MTLFVALLLKIPVNLILYCINDPSFRPFLSAFLGISTQILYLKLGSLFLILLNILIETLYSVVFTIITFILIKALKNKAPRYIIAFSVLCALAYHIHLGSLGLNLWERLYRFTLISNCGKAISLSWCYSDSFKDPQSLSSGSFWLNCPIK